MLNHIKYIFIFLLIISASTAHAQQDTSMTREVEVTKTFKPTMSSDANKINEMPKIDQTEHQPPKFDYSIYSQPIFNAFSVTPLKAATIRSAQKKETGYGLVRVGIGNYNKPYGELFFNHLNTKKSVFGIHAKHLSSHGKVTLDGGDKVDAPFSKNEAELYYKHDLNKSILSVTADYTHDGFKYYGYPIDPIPPVLLEKNPKGIYLNSSQTFSKGGLNINLKNHVAEMDDPAYNFIADYHYFSTKTEQTEHFAELKMDFQKPLDQGTVLADFGASFVQSDNHTILKDTVPEIGQRQQTWIYLKPAYYIEGKTASISIGLNAWFAMDKESNSVVKLTPNIRAEYEPVEDKFKLFAGVDGKYVNNHYSKIAYENPFVDPLHNVTNSFEKLHFYGGFDGKFSSKTNFKISVDYSMIDDQQFYYLNEYYLPDPSINPNPLVVNNTFDVLYDNINLLKINLEIFHTSSEKLNLLLSGNYYGYKLEAQTEAWNMPSWDANLSLDYKITEQLSVGADIYLIGGRKALIVESTNFLSSGPPTINKSYNLDTVIDLNVNANYLLTQKFSVFAQLNNFGIQKYQRWFGYPVQSFNALVGISYAF